MDLAGLVVRHVAVVELAVGRLDPLCQTVEGVSLGHQTDPQPHLMESLRSDLSWVTPHCKCK